MESIVKRRGSTTACLLASPVTCRRRAGCSQFFALALFVLALAAMTGTAQADVYWANVGTDTIGRANLDGTNPVTNYISSFSLQMAISGGYLYYDNYSAGGDAIGRASLDGSSNDPNFITGLTNPAGVTINNSGIYWLQVAGFSGTAIYEAGLDGSNPHAIVTGINGGYDIVATSSNIYWSSGCTGGGSPCTGWISQADLSGNNVVQYWASGYAPFGLAADNTYVYWATGAGSINRTNISNQGTQTLVSGLPDAVGVAVDTTGHLYWTEGLSTSGIGRADLGTGGATNVNSNFITGISEPSGIAVDGSNTGPVISQPPTIGGSALQGQTLQESHGFWSGSPASYTYQWERCSASGAGCAAVSGATQQSYVLGGADVGSTLLVQEVAINAYGSSVPATSAPAGVVQSGAPVNGSPPVISGTAAQGQTLAESHGSWTNSPVAFTFQWLRCTASGVNCAAITGATQQSYLLSATDIGSTLQIQEIASNAYGSSPAAISSPTGVVQSATPFSGSTPLISGSTQEGQALTESHAQWTNAPSSYGYEWWRCDAAGGACTAVAGATFQVYVVGGGDLGSTLRVQEFATNAYGTGSSALSPASGVVQPPPPPVPDATSVSLSASPNLALPGKSVKLLAHVIDDGSPGIVPRGGVTFLAGSHAVGTTALNEHGFATLTTKSLHGPQQSLTAVFTPEQGWSASVSNVYDELILPPSHIPAPKGCTRLGSKLPVKVTNSAEIQSVTYLIDGRRVDVSRHSPFAAHLSTKSLKRGRHHLTAELRYHTAQAGNLVRMLRGTFHVC
jgi:hypothetical protein